MMTMHTPQMMAANNASIWPWPMSWKPGLSTTMAPTKPTPMAAQRRTPARSPNTFMARMVAKMGAVKTSAVTSASGVIDRA